MIRLDQVLDKLRTIPWNQYTDFAFLTGSLVSRGVGNDIDIVVSRVRDLGDVW